METNSDHGLKVAMDAQAKERTDPKGDEREQPWKAFWPPNIQGLSEEELRLQPWLTWSTRQGETEPGEPEPEKPDPDSKPWYDWMRKGSDANLPGVVCRRGAG